jgi:hypothetical protein
MKRKTNDQERYLSHLQRRIRDLEKQLEAAKSVKTQPGTTAGKRRYQVISSDEGEDEEEGSIVDASQPDGRDASPFLCESPDTHSEATKKFSMGKDIAKRRREVS